MISWAAFEAALVNWLVPAYVPRAIFANQRAPQPAMPYASLLLMASAKEGGRDPAILTQDLTRAKSVRLTPTVQNNATYTVTVAGTPYTYVAQSRVVEADIVAGPNLGADGGTVTVNGHVCALAYDLKTLGDNINALGQPVTVSTPDGWNTLVIDGAGFAVSVPPTLTMTTTVVSDDASAITSGLKAAMAAETRTVTDNHGTLDITGTAIFALTVTTNLTWVNLDAGHEIVTTIYGSRRLSYQIKVYVDEGTAGGAYAWAESIRSSLGLPSVIDALDAAGIAIVKDSGARDMSAVINGQWVQQAVVDVVFRAVVQMADDTGYIAHAVATGTTDAGTVVVNMEDA